MSDKILQISFPAKRRATLEPAQVLTDERDLTHVQSASVIADK